MRSNSLWKPAPFARTPRLSQAKLPLSEGAPEPGYAAFTINDVIVPKNLASGVALAAGGGIVTAISGLLPEKIRPAAMIAGIGLIGFGGYKAYQHFFGDPDLTITEIPAQNPKDLTLVKGEIMKPVDGGMAEKSSMWTVFWKSDRTYVVQFLISNNSVNDLQVPIVFKVGENPAIGDHKFTQAAYVVSVGAGKKAVVNGYQPIASELAGGISAVGTLILKGPTPMGKDDRILDVSKFTI